MKTLDELLILHQKLTEMLSFAKALGGKVSIGNEIITAAELKETLTELKIEIESRRSQIPPLRRVK